MMESNLSQSEHVETPRRSGRPCCWDDGTGWLLAVAFHAGHTKVTNKKRMLKMSSSQIPDNA